MSFLEQWPQIWGLLWPILLSMTFSLQGRRTENHLSARKWHIRQLRVIILEGKSIAYWWEKQWKIWLSNHSLLLDVLRMSQFFCYHGLQSLPAGFKVAFSGEAFWRVEERHGVETHLDATTQGFWKWFKSLVWVSVLAEWISRNCRVSSRQEE